MKKNKQKEEQFIVAAQNGDFKTIEKLLKKINFDVNVADSYSRTALHYAVRYYVHEDNMSKSEKIKIMELLINNGADLSAQDGQGETVLSFAIKYGHLDVVKLLFKYKAYIGPKDYKGFTPLDSAIEFTDKSSEIGIFIRENLAEAENQLNEYHEQNCTSVPRCSR